MVETHYRGHRFIVNGREIKVESPSGKSLGTAKSFAGARNVVKRSLKAAA